VGGPPGTAPLDGRAVVPTVEGGGGVTELAVEKMSCDHCVRRVRQALDKAGIAAEDVQIGSVRVAVADASRAAEVLGRAGYPAALRT
jgi:copper chaperone CopZ